MEEGGKERKRSEGDGKREKSEEGGEGRRRKKNRGGFREQGERGGRRLCSTFFIRTPSRLYKAIKKENQ